MPVHPVWRLGATGPAFAGAAFALVLAILPAGAQPLPPDAEAIVKQICINNNEPIEDHTGVGALEWGLCGCAYPGSRCGEPARLSTCWCGNDCERYGDCCLDKPLFCPD